MRTSLIGIVLYQMYTKELQCNKLACQWDLLLYSNVLNICITL